MAQEDRAADGSGQAAEFLELLAPDGNLAGLLWRQTKADKMVPGTPANATHYCPARCGAKRRLVDFEEQLAIVIDDVGTKRNVPKVVPSLIVETRPGNLQYVYLLEPGASLEAVQTLLGVLNHELELGDPNAYRPNQPMRLPGGRLPPGKTHGARLLPAEPGAEEVKAWPVEGLYRDFECRHSIAERIAEAQARREARKGVAPGANLPEAVALMAMLDPDMGRNDGWMTVVFALHHESNGGEEGLRPLHEWSSGGRSYDAAELDYQWSNLEGRDVDDPVTVGSLRHLARAVDRTAAEAIIEEHERLRQTATEAGMAAIADAGGTTGEPPQGRRPSDVVMPELLERLVLTPQGVVDLGTQPLTVVSLDTMAMLFNVHDDPPTPPARTYVSVVKARWVRHPHKQYSIKPPQYLPRQPFGFIPERQEDGHVVGMINAYRPRTMKSDGPQPGDEGRVEAFLRHMAWTYPGEGDADYALDWFASKLQHPWQRMTALCNVTPEQGTGRTSAATLLALVLGRGNSMVMSIHRILDDPYNTYLKLPLLIVNEAESLPGEGGTKFRAGRTMIDRLNDIIDPGGGEVSIREMRVDPYSVLSPMAAIINSNRPAALQLDDRDRRFDISRGNDRRMPDKLAKWIQDVIRPGVEDERALDAVQRYLLARDVSGFQYWDVRRSEAKAVMASEARTGIEVAVDSALEAIGQPEVITTALLGDVLKSTAMRKADREAYDMVKGMSDKELMFALRAWGHDHTHVPGCMGGVVDIQIAGEKHRPRERNGCSRYRELEQRKAMAEALKQLRDKVGESVQTGIIHPFVVHVGGKNEAAPDDDRED